MNEFSLIDQFFNFPYPTREDIVFGIGDDAACVRVPAGQDLLISTDTLVEDVHFLSSWDAYDIAYKAVMVNISDMAAMAATPTWICLALTIPEQNLSWLQQYSQGIRDALNEYKLVLIGGDMTKGPLSMTISIYGIVPLNKAIRRKGAKPGDKIFVSGELGGACLALQFLKKPPNNQLDFSKAMKKLLHPQPRVDLGPILQATASSCIDISDGLSADLNHICEQSGVGAYLEADKIPVFSLAEEYMNHNARTLALTGGDDYELCFTIPPEKEEQFLTMIAQNGISCFEIGVIEKSKGLRIKQTNGALEVLKPQGYLHF